MKALRIVPLVVIAAIVAVALFFVFGRSRADIVVAGKNFTEQSIVGEMAAQLIEANTELTVGRSFRLATNLPIKLIQKGEIDLYLDYTGTGYVDILRKPFKGESPEEVYQHVKGVYPEKFGLRWLSPLGFKNTYTLTMRRKHAESLGIEKISDLARHTGLRAGFDPAFLDRPDGYPGLRQHYGFEFDKSPGQLAIGLMCRQCREGQVDVIDAFSTDGKIDRFDLKILEDDKHFFPPYDAAFVIRQDVAEEHPEVVEALERLAGKLDNETMRKMNYAVEEEGRLEKDVAREFLVSQGLLK